MAARSKKKIAGTRNDVRPNGKAWSTRKHGDKPSDTVVTQAQKDHDRTAQEKLKAKGKNADKEIS